jgi:TonB family protein
VVQKVIEASQVSDAMPSTELWHRAAASSAAPMVSGADTPSYPSLALNAGITGTVVVNVTVNDGEITSTTVESGDRMLAAGAIQNIKSWHFAEGTSQTVTATFIFEVERRDVGANPNPKIEMQLPSLVRITAASRDW